MTPSDIEDAIRSMKNGGGASLDDIDVFIGDYFNDDIVVTIGAIDRYQRCLVS